MGTFNLQFQLQLSQMSPSAADLSEDVDDSGFN